MDEHDNLYRIFCGVPQSVGDMPSDEGGTTPRVRLLGVSRFRGIIPMRFRPNLTTLEDRRVPAAIACVGGWGASMYQYAHREPVADDVWVDGKVITADPATFRGAPTAPPSFGSLYGLNNAGQSGGDADIDPSGATVAPIKTFDGTRPETSNTIYVGTDNGGVWKTVDGGSQSALNGHSTGALRTVSGNNT
jgi:hypothetical protein